METVRSDGTLEYKHFVDELSRFTEIVQRNPEENVNWEIKKFHDDVGGLVLIRKSLVQINSPLGEDDATLSGFADEQQLESDGKECASAEQNLISIEHQIVYSISYSVPVLYFKSCLLNGRSLTVEEIWRLIPRFCSQFAGGLDKEQLITMITQFEHPILQKPFFAVHPCKTSELMSNLLKSFDRTKMNYILSWLSTVGPISGLNLRLQSI